LRAYGVLNDVTSGGQIFIGDFPFRPGRASARMNAPYHQKAHAAFPNMPKNSNFAFNASLCACNEIGEV
jgi:hypothetical protein